jgi:hypothetical protein
VFNKDLQDTFGRGSVAPARLRNTVLDCYAVTPVMFGFSPVCLVYINILNLKICNNLNYK